MAGPLSVRALYVQEWAAVPIVFPDMFTQLVYLSIRPGYSIPLEVYCLKKTSISADRTRRRRD
jgi:hypothetical protein